MVGENYDWSILQKDPFIAAFGNQQLRNQCWNWFGVFTTNLFVQFFLFTFPSFRLNSSSQFLRVALVCNNSCSGIFLVFKIRNIVSNYASSFVRYLVFLFTGIWYFFSDIWYFFSQSFGISFYHHLVFLFTRILYFFSQ